FGRAHCEALGSLVATMPWRASTSERPWPSQPCAREPGTALMVLPGCGVSAEGAPKAVGDCALPMATQLAIASADTSTTVQTPNQWDRRGEGLDIEPSRKDGQIG